MANSAFTGVGTDLSAFAPIASPTFTGTVTVPATNFTVGASLPFSDSAGTLTLQNIDVIATTTRETLTRYSNGVSRMINLGIFL